MDQRIRELALLIKLKYDRILTYSQIYDASTDENTLSIYVDGYPLVETKINNVEEEKRAVDDIFFTLTINGLEKLMKNI